MTKKRQTDGTNFQISKALKESNSQMRKKDNITIKTIPLMSLWLVKKTSFIVYVYVFAPLSSGINSL